MDKILTSQPRRRVGRYPSLKILITMKFTLVFLTVFSAGLQASTLAQTVNLHVEDVSMDELFSEIRKQTGYRFIYEEGLIDQAWTVSMTISKASLQEAMDKAVEGYPLAYGIHEGTIVVKRAPAAEGAQPEKPQELAEGQVEDESGLPLPGVSVKVVGKSAGTATDEEGRFELPASEGDSLLFTYLGHEPVTRAVTGQAMRVVMMPAAGDLEEVVVVGYGTQKKVNLTGSVSVVDGDELAKRPVGQTSAALQGMAPGVTVTQSSGQPGRDGGTVRIRGIGSISGGGQGPLVILDGVQSSLNNVDPSEIESISVLKDAASSAIYGSRAANGVILITTKRASEKGFSIDYNTYSGWQTPTDMPDIVGAIDHMEMINEAYTNTGRSPLYPQEEIEAHRTQGSANRDRYPDTDWQDLTLKNNSFMQSHYLGITGGSERIRLLGSFSLLDQDGIIPNTSFRRYNLRVNSDIELSDKFSSSMDIFLRRTELKEPSSGTGYVFHWMRRIPANQAGILSDGSYGEGWNGDHPLARAKDGGLNQVMALSAILNLRFRYQPVEWLSAELMYAPKFNEPHTKSFSNTIQTYRWDFSPSYAVPAINSLSDQFRREWYNNLRATVTFDKNIAGDHQLTVLGGFQQEDERANFVSAYRERFPLPEYQEITSGDRENERTGGNASEWALRSFFARLNYNYQEKYLFEANARYDGSSRFASGNKYTLFPSFSAGWRISQEPFMRGLQHLVTDLKLRASWGRLGNQESTDLYAYAAFVGIGNSNYVFGDRETIGSSLNVMANPDIIWETTTVSDVGLDLNLWSKFTLTADYYYRKTDGILLRLDIPTMLGLTAPFQNAGVVENKGWDLQLGYQDQAGELGYGITVNLSDVKNKVLDMKGIERTGRQVTREGYAINSFFGYQSMGFFRDEADVAGHADQSGFGSIAPGDLKYRDLNGDGEINTADQAILGNPIPRYTYSANLDLSYKGLDLSVFLQGVGKADGFMFGQGIMPFFLGGTVQEQHKDRWTPDNPDASFPRFAFNESNNEQNSDFWMRNAAYLRVKNIQLGYTFSPSFLKERVQRLRIYVSGQNLFTFDNFWQGYDVEAPVSSGGWYPQMKVYNIGLDVRF